MLFKSLEFKNVVGQKVIVTDIPVLDKDSPYHMLLNFRLQSFVAVLYRDKNVKRCYSFKEHLKSVMKWPIYEEIYSCQNSKTMLK